MKDVSTLSFEQLQQENARLLSLIGLQEQKIGQQEQRIHLLQHQLHLFRTARFGRKSEKNSVAEQLPLVFDEVVLTEEVVVAEEAQETISYTRKKNTGRKALPKSLPYLEKVYDLTDAEKQCACGSSLTHINDEITEQLDVIPQMTFRIVHIRKKYACKNCEETICLAPLPKQPIPQSIASPGLLAAVADSKFNRHMPLYRQEAMFHEAKIALTRGTLSNWIIHGAHLLTPLVKLMIADIYDYDIAFADETPLQVLRKKDRPPSQKSTMWLFIGGPPEKRAFVYQYHPTRAHQIPADFFADFQGYLHADCYAAYVALGQREKLTHVACMAHARRYFVDVSKSSQKEGLAHHIITLIAKLYHIEKKLKESNATPACIFITRIKEARPILNQIKALMDEAYPKTLPKSPLGAALFYALTHWDALNAYLYDGRLEIDNNRSERAIKPFVIGRKNWLFHGNELGAKAGSILFSLIETCKYHQINVFSWLKYVFANIHYAHNIDELQKLLPYNINPLLLINMRTIPDLIFPE